MLFSVLRIHKSKNSKTLNISSGGSYEADQIDNASTVKQGISKVYEKVSANSYVMQCCFFSLYNGGRYCAMIQKNSANYGTAIVFSYSLSNIIYKFTYATGTETLVQFSGTEV